MDSKLTLKLNTHVINKAKRYAGKNGKSLSQLVENFFKRLTTEPGSREHRAPPIVSRLKGAAKTSKPIPTNDDYAAYLEEKYK